MLIVNTGFGTQPKLPNPFPRVIEKGFFECENTGLTKSGLTTYNLAYGSLKLAFSVMGSNLREALNRDHKFLCAHSLFDFIDQMSKGLKSGRVLLDLPLTLHEHSIAKDILDPYARSFTCVFYAVNFIY